MCTPSTRLLECETPLPCPSVSLRLYFMSSCSHRAAYKHSGTVGIRFQVSCGLQRDPTRRGTFGSSPSILKPGPTNAAVHFSCLDVPFFGAPWHRSLSLASFLGSSIVSPSEHIPPCPFLSTPMSLLTSRERYPGQQHHKRHPMLALAMCRCFFFLTLTRD